MEFSSSISNDIQSRIQLQQRQASCSRRFRLSDLQFQFDDSNIIDRNKRIIYSTANPIHILLCRYASATLASKSTVYAVTVRYKYNNNDNNIQRRRQAFTLAVFDHTHTHRTSQPLDSGMRMLRFRRRQRRGTLLLLLVHRRHFPRQLL